ncbi:hypothetical protein T260_08110 [Geobacillus thermopakistaniensis]|uniref:Uncharacterized protein n=1 Tax=Geobacillus thermopakistaniensis (strain MAS1) TaxID=1408282 RepID=A0A7U9P686_GEOTM|nr:MULTISPECIES: hypothetical protein [Bacillaceae]ESU72417.1 hypothetical protein T260_08110 [Geobacillus sp. MAS1]
MSKLVDGADFFKKFWEDIAGAEKSVMIISLYISKKAVLKIINRWRESCESDF